jgi:hypothetical protein
MNTPSDLTAGNVLTTNLAFQVPQGAKGLKLVYKPAALLGDDITVSLGR